MYLLIRKFTFTLPKKEVNVSYCDQVSSKIIPLYSTVEGMSMTKCHPSWCKLTYASLPHNSALLRVTMPAN